MKYKEFVQSRMFSIIIYVIGGLLVALVIFQAGIFVGYRVASFSMNWDIARNGNVRDPRSVFAPFMRDADDMNPHGAVGEIISVKWPTIMVKGPNGNEMIVLLSSTTSIRSLRGEISSSSLKVGEQVVSIGVPDDRGDLNATFVRIIPPPPQDESTSSLIINNQ